MVNTKGRKIFISTFLAFYGKFFSIFPKYSEKKFQLFFKIWNFTFNLSHLSRSGKILFLNNFLTTDRWLILLGLRYDTTNGCLWSTIRPRDGEACRFTTFQQGKHVSQRRKRAWRGRLCWNGWQLWVRKISQATKSKV